MGALLGWVVTKLFTDGLLKYLAIKAIALALVCIVLPVILNNFAWDIIDIILSIVTDNLEGYNFTEQMVSVTGAGAYLFQKCKLVESLSVIMSALTVRMTLNAIPFVNV